jgi:hypothetical protein
LKHTANVEQYIERNFPDLFPATKSRFKAYINALLHSEDVSSLLDSIAAYTDPGLESELTVPGGASEFFLHRELHPLAGKYQDLRFQTVLAYSRYFKDETLFRMIADWFLKGDAEVRYGNIATWPVVKTMDEPRKYFDQGYTMDMYVQGLSVVMFRMFYSLDRRIPGYSFEELKANIDELFNLLILVTPARVPVIFNTVPSFYIGIAPFKFDLDVVSGGLYVEGESVSVNPNRPFFLENDREVVNLLYEGDLEVEMENGMVFTGSGTFSGGMEVPVHPFDDQNQLDILAGLSVDKLGNKDGGYYASVESSMEGPYVFISREGRRLTLLVESSVPIQWITLFSEHPELSNIEMRFNTSLMPRYIQGAFPLFGVRVFIDFG